MSYSVARFLGMVLAMICIPATAFSSVLWTKSIETGGVSYKVQIEKSDSRLELNVYPDYGDKKDQSLDSYSYYIDGGDDLIAEVNRLLNLDNGDHETQQALIGDLLKNMSTSASYILLKLDSWTISAPEFTEVVRYRLDDSDDSKKLRELFKQARQLKDLIVIETSLGFNASSNYSELLKLIKITPEIWEEKFTDEMTMSFEAHRLFQYIIAKQEVTELNLEQLNQDSSENSLEDILSGASKIDDISASVLLGAFDRSQLKGDLQGSIFFFPSQMSFVFVRVLADDEFTIDDESCRRENWVLAKSDFLNSFYSQSADFTRYLEIRTNGQSEPYFPLSRKTERSVKDGNIVSYGIVDASVETKFSSQGRLIRNGYPGSAFRITRSTQITTTQAGLVYSEANGFIVKNDIREMNLSYNEYMTHVPDWRLLFNKSRYDSNERAPIEWLNIRNNFRQGDYDKIQALNADSETSLEENVKRQSLNLFNQIRPRFLICRSI